MKQIPEIGDSDAWVASVPQVYMGPYDINLPVIIKQPQSTTVKTGQPVGISVQAIRTTSYQWQAYISGAWSNIAYTDSQIKFDSADASMVGTYRCILTGADGTEHATSSAAIVVVE